MDGHTIRTKLKEPFAPYMVSWQKTSIIPKHVLSSVGDINTAPFNTAPVGTGPFAPIFAYQLVVGVHDRVAGYEPNPYTASNSWNPEAWSTT